MIRPAHVSYRDVRLISLSHWQRSRTDRVLYSPERLSQISVEAAKQNSVFSLEDRIGLVHDSFALAKAGFLKMSSALNLVQELRHEKECKRRIDVVELGNMLKTS